MKYEPKIGERVRVVKVWSPYKGRCVGKIGTVDRVFGDGDIEVRLARIIHEASWT